MREVVRNVATPSYYVYRSIVSTTALYLYDAFSNVPQLLMAMI